MSGASLATGPRPAEKRHLRNPQGGVQAAQLQEESGFLGGVMGSLRVIELQLVAFIVVFSASGLVPVEDLLFPVFISAYAFALSAVVFPSYGSGQAPDVFKGRRLFQLYVGSGTAIGLFLPLAYVLGGFARGDQESLRAATPHLFLLSFQVLSENLISGLQIFSLPIRALLPILYTTRRLFALMTWVRATWGGIHASEQLSSVPSENILDPKFKDWAWVSFGRLLAAANLIYFTVNLFCFLIPMFLPRAFEQYFEQREQYKAQQSSKQDQKKADEKNDHDEKKDHNKEQEKKSAQPSPYAGLGGQNNVEKKGQ